MTESTHRDEIIFCNNDLSDNLYQKYKSSQYLAVDTEAMGLVHGRDRLCLIQICNEFKLTSCIKIDKGIYEASNLKILFESNPILLRKIISKTGNDIVSISFYDHNFNAIFEKDFFSFVPIYLD